MLIEFLKVYGALLACVCVILAMGATLAVCVSKVKKLECAVSELKNDILARLDAQEKATAEDKKKERRLINESMANLSESVTRAVFTLKADADKKDA